MSARTSFLYFLQLAVVLLSAHSFYLFCKFWFHIDTDTVLYILGDHVICQQSP